MGYGFIASRFLWGLGALFAKRLSGSWVVLIPAFALPLLANRRFEIEQWRWVMLISLFLTMVMLVHKKWRHYVLLPSCLVLTGGLAVLMLNCKLI